MVSSVTVAAIIAIFLLRLHKVQKIAYRAEMSAAVSELGDTNGIPRGAGRPADKCPPGTLRDLAGALCYPNCRNNAAAAADFAANLNLQLDMAGTGLLAAVPAGIY